MTSKEQPESVSSWTERRSDVVNRVACEISAVGQPVTVSHANLSGVTIETPVPLRVGSVHQCRFKVDNDMVSLSARVIDSRHRPRTAGHTIGLQFRRLAARDDAAAERLMSRILGPLFMSGPTFA